MSHGFNIKKIKKRHSDFMLLEIFSAVLTCQHCMVYDWNKSQMARCVLDTEKAG